MPSSNSEHKQVLRLRCFVPVVFYLLVPIISFSQTCSNPGARLNRLRSTTVTADTTRKWVKNDLAVIRLKPRDTIADIGSLNGYFPLLYSIYSDSVTFYLNDIVDSGFQYFDSIKTECTRLRETELTNEFELVVGTEYATALPANKFNKVVVRDALHHFSYPDSMLTDIQRIMKPGARLIIFEPLRNPKRSDPLLCRGAMTKEEFLTLMTNNGFKLTSKKNVGKDRYWFVFREGR